MNKRDLLETFINLLPKANTLSGKHNKCGSIVVSSGKIDIQDYMFDFNVKDKNFTGEEKDIIISNLVEANKKLIDLATYSNDISKILSDTIMKTTK